MKNIFKQKKGITLIALVITIIVLLILAGISITMLTGDNSILNRATEAKIKNLAVTEEEQIKIQIMGSLNNDGTLNLEKLKTNLEKISDITVTGTNFPLTVAFSEGNTYTINSKGVVADINNSEYVTLKTAELTEKYGEEVTYTGYEASNVSKWRLYYADSDNIYLLSEPGEHIQNSYFEYDEEIKERGISLNSSSIIWNYQCGIDAHGNIIVHKGQKAAAYLTNTELWKQYCNSSAKWAMGAPTVEMFLASYNSTHTSQKTISSNERGYYSPICTFEYENTIDNDIYCSTDPSRNYWLASPSVNPDYNMLMAVGANEFIEGPRITGYGWCSSLITGLRLRYLVCIPREKLDVENMKIL